MRVRELLLPIVERLDRELNLSRDYPDAWRQIQEMVKAGEEYFAVYFPNVDLSQNSDVADIIQSSFEEASMDVLDEKDVFSSYFERLREQEAILAQFPEGKSLLEARDTIMSMIAGEMSKPDLTLLGSFLNLWTYTFTGHALVDNIEGYRNEQTIAELVEAYGRVVGEIQRVLDWYTKEPLHDELLAAPFDLPESTANTESEPLIEVTAKVETLAIDQPPSEEISSHAKTPAEHMDAQGAVDHTEASSPQEESTDAPSSGSRQQLDVSESDRIEQEPSVLPEPTQMPEASVEPPTALLPTPPLPEPPLVWETPSEC